MSGDGLENGSTRRRRNEIHLQIPVNEDLEVVGKDRGRVVARVFVACGRRRNGHGFAPLTDTLLETAAVA